MMSSSRFFHPLFVLIGILLLKALAMCGVIAYSGIGLGPDEAQYWTWSQQLDWGYYSKPPGIAWDIAAGCALWGNTEFGVRFGALLFSAGLSLGVYALALAVPLSPWVAFWAGVVMALSPVGLLSSLFATTDAPFVFFWTLGCLELVKGMKGEGAPSYGRLGLWIALGALFKWPIYYLWIIATALALFIPRWRRGSWWGGVAISLFGLLPSFIWNLQHDAATFRHVWSTIVDGNHNAMTMAHKGNFWDFLGAQVVFLSPIWFGLLVMAYFLAAKRWKEERGSLLLCGAITLGILALNMGMATFRKMQGNWAVYAYPTGIVFFCGILLERTSWAKAWIKVGLWVSLFLAGLILLLPTVQRQGWFPQWPIPFRSDPFKECLGWEHLSPALQEARFVPEKDFLFGDRYQSCSLISFYNPKQQRAYFLNIQNVRHNQFSFWPSMAKEQMGKTGYYVFVANEREMGNSSLQSTLQAKLEHYFNQVHFTGSYPLFEAYGRPVKVLWVFRCVGYNGQQPQENALW